VKIIVRIAGIERVGHTPMKGEGKENQGDSPTTVKEIFPCPR
jgi:hypothetical protein